MNGNLESGLCRYVGVYYRWLCSIKHWSSIGSRGERVKMSVISSLIPSSFKIPKSDVVNGSIPGYRRK